MGCFDIFACRAREGERPRGGELGSVGGDGREQESRASDGAMVLRSISGPSFYTASILLGDARWPQQAWTSALRNQKEGSVKGAVSTPYS